MSDDVEPYDLVQRAKGRARFCRDRGEVKTPELLEELVARIEELTRERDVWREKHAHMTKCEADQRARADKLAALLREAGEELRSFMASYGKRVPSALVIRGAILETTPQTVCLDQVPWPDFDHTRDLIVRMQNALEG